MSSSNRPTTTIDDQHLIKALRESEKYLRSVFRAAPTGIGVVVDRVLTQVNNRMCVITGYTEQELVGQSARMLYQNDEDFEYVGREKYAQIRDHGTGTVETRLQRKDGKIINVLLSSTPLDLDDISKGVTFTALDITERKQAEEKLRDTNQLLQQERNMFVSGAVVVFKWRNHEGWPTDYVSPNVVDIFGYTPEEFTKGLVSYDKITHPDDLDRVIEEVRIGTDSDAPQFTYEPYRVYKKDGSEIWLIGYSTIVRDETGNILYYLGYVLDITKRKRAEDALIESENRYQELFNSVMEGIVIADTNSIVKYCNPAYVNIFEEDSASNLINKNILDFIPDNQDEIVLSENKKRQRGEGSQYELEITTAKGRKKTILVSAMPRHDSNGDFIGSFGSVLDITDRKQAEEALKDSEEKFRLLSDQSLMGIIILQNELFVYVNDCAAAIMETPTEEIAKWSPGDYAKLIHPDDLPFVMEQGRKKQAREMGAVTHYNWRMVTPDGNVKWIDMWSKTISFQGKFADMVTMIDITDRKQAENLIRVQRDLGISLGKSIDFREVSRLCLRASLEASEMDCGGIYIVDLATRAMDSHHQEGLSEDFAAASAHYEADSPNVRLVMAGEPIYTSHKELGVPMRSGMVEEALKGIAVVPFKYANRVVGCLNVASRIYEEVPQFARNTLEMIASQIGDAIANKQAEEALRESEEKFRTYVSNAPDAIFIADAQGRYVDVNEAACKLTGYSESELSSMSILDINDPETQPNPLSSFMDLKKTGRAKMEFRLKRKDGSCIWSSLHAVALSDDRLMAFCSDITETKRLRELESRAQRLETAGQIAGQVAHDFNNLLAPLMAYPEFIREELPDGHSALKYLVDIENAAQQIADINQQLLTLGRRGHYNQEVMNLNEVVSQAVRQMEALPSTLVVETKLDDELMNIKGGSSQLFRALSNLLINAREAMQDIGQITIRTENYYVDKIWVNYTQVPQGEYVKLTISDTGCGIPGEIKQKIFEPFFTTKTADRKRGSGLGISVVDAVIKDHDGYIDVTTKMGEGTSFFIYFPVTRDSVVTPLHNEIVGGTETVLIVDDDKVQRDVCTKLLSSLGYQTTTIESGEGALRLLKEQSFDLLILDMIMPPGIDGAETFRQTLLFNPEQKAIIVSGFAESDRVAVALKMGAGAFVKKPLTRRHIAAAVRNELDRVTRPV